MNIYLDIDGVMLPNHLYRANHQDKLRADHLHEFLEYVTSRYSTYWLTAHCRGDTRAPVEHLSKVLDNATLELVKQIKSTNWKKLKTEGIDFTESFLWFDDMLLDGERDVLIENDALNSWIQVDLSKNSDQLLLFTRNFPSQTVR